MKKLGLVLAVAMSMAPSVHAADPVAAPTPMRGWDFSQAERIPIQSGGRIKPMDSFAGEGVLFLTGRGSYAGWNNTELLLSLLSRPEAWQKEPLIRVDQPDLRRQLLLDEKRIMFSPEELFHSPVVLQYAEHLDNAGKQLMDPRGAVGQVSPREREFKRVLNRLGLYRSLVSGEAWTAIPAPPAENWQGLATEANPGPLREAYAEMVRAYHRGDQSAFEKSAGAVRAAIEAAIPGWDGGQRTLLQAEVFYHKLHPFRWACTIYLLAGLLWALTQFSGGMFKKRLTPFAMAATWIGLAFHLTGFGLRVWIAGRPPVSNMYESVIWVSFGVMFFSLIIYFVQKQKQPILLGTSAVLSGLGLLAADASPAIMDPTIQPLVPVLRSNFWLTIHVLTITLGYAAFALTFGLGNVALFQFLKSDSKGKKAMGSAQRIALVNQLLYRAMQIGVVCLAAGTILGGVWADYSWGRFWGWDPKETWALIALLTYVAVLHARYTGWIGQFGYPAWSVVCFLSVVMAWYGVNYVLGVGLHSYGFSSGGVGSVAAVCMAQLGFVLLVTILHARRTGDLFGK
ncbi:MAG TPA: cytochrome c biogenesis protein CcsA, partial [Bdellovibrionota bacterium]|nr:cytochrome c biogenesis protein CcsA [Bdellovibrionota bacterium]